MEYSKKCIKTILSGMLIFTSLLSTTSFAYGEEIDLENEIGDYTSINTQDLNLTVQDNSLITTPTTRSMDSQDTITKFNELMETNSDLKSQVINLLNSGDELVGVANTTIEVIKYIDEFGNEVYEPLSELEQVTPMQMIKSSRGTGHKETDFSRGQLNYSLMVYWQTFGTNPTKYLGASVTAHWTGDMVFDTADAVGDGKDAITINMPGNFYMYSDENRFNQTYPSNFCYPEVTFQNSDVLVKFYEKSGVTNISASGDDQQTAGPLGRVSTTYLHTYIGLSLGPTVSLPGGFSIGLGAGISYWTRALAVDFKYN